MHARIGAASAVLGAMLLGGACGPATTPVVAEYPAVYRAPEPERNEPTEGAIEPLIDARPVAVRVQFEGREPLPKGAVLQVHLARLPEAGGPAIPVIEKSADVSGRSEGVNVELYFKETERRATGRYSLSARVEDQRGRVRAITTEPLIADAAELRKPVTIFMEPVAPPASTEHE